MARSLSGPDALQRIDFAISDMRRMVADAIADADRTTAREAEVRAAQLRHFGQLAEIRLDVIASTIDKSELDRLHKEADRLLQDHADYLEREAQALAAAASQIKALEDKRADLARQHANAVEKYERKVAEVETGLKTDADYQALVKTNETNAAIAARAHQKLEVARAELDEKGAPYRNDKLFAYLWKRRFRAPDYKAGPITRMLDNWVARLCKYDQAFLNYQRLTDLPEWLEDHAADQDTKAAAALDALEEAEEAALEKAGASALRAKANALLEDVRATDRAIDEAEQVHQEIAARHAAALNDEVGPAQNARRLLEQGLAQTSFQDLRTLAAETIDQTDDRIVDGLVKLRTEQMSLELESERLSGLPEHLREDLSNLESLRRKFKNTRFDSAYATFPSSTVDDILASIVQGRMSANDGHNRLARAIRRIEPRAEPGFGGNRRSQTIGLPPVLGDVIWEIAKESMKGGRSGGFTIGGSGGSSRRSPRINIPRGGSRGGSSPRRSGGGGFRTKKKF